MSDIVRENDYMSRMDGSKEQNLDAQNEISEKELEQQFELRTKVITEVILNLALVKQFSGV
jgi:hypothetical protein